MKETLEQQIKTLDLKQNAIKILINSFYGAFGNKFFYFHDNEIAQSITLQGQDLIKFTIRAINHYFKTRWHLDVELHKQLGLYGKYKINQIDQDTAIYSDTDSVYSAIEFAIKSIEGLTLTEDEALQMCLDINNYRLQDYFVEALNKYAKHYHTTNNQTFEMENLSRAGIFVAKKKYLLEVASHGDHLTKNRTLLIKGLEAVQASYPIWARDNLRKIYWLLLDKGYDLDIEKDLIPLYKELREEIEILHIDDLAFNFNVRVYEKSLIKLNPLVLDKGMPIYGRAVAYHNHIIEKTHNQKYSHIREGSKIKFYYTEDNEYGFDVFAYAPGEFPDFALKMDKTQQFYRLIIEPINKLLVAMELGEITANLTRFVKKVKLRQLKNITPELYPLFSVNPNTLEYVEVPETVQEYVNNTDLKIPPKLLQTFIGAITKYGLNTIIVPKSELHKYRSTLAKKLNIVVVDPFKPTPEEMERNLISWGWTKIEGNYWITVDRLNRYAKNGKDYSKFCYFLEDAYKKADRANKKLQHKLNE